MQTVPADIAAAIDALDQASRALGSAERTNCVATRISAERPQYMRRKDLDSAILKHLRDADEIVKEDDGA